jgi:peptidoglycan/xylan/chitin deacetylase (PgdA/CDA1 family)
MIKPILSKLNFALGRNPQIIKNTYWKKYIPESYNSVLLISADFEMAWAWQYAKSLDDPIKAAKKMALRERKNIPMILELCDHFNIPITWATVGHLFLNDCTRNNGKAHPEIPDVKHYSGPYWDFYGDDWFKHDPCTNMHCSPEWYALDLIKQILKSPVEHEIGSHSFSHIDCRDGICSPELMRAELKVSKKLAEMNGIELKSFVHPGNTIGNLKILSEEGFTSFRSGNVNTLGYPIKNKSGLWEYSNTFSLSYRKDFSLKYQQNRYIRIVKRAIKSKTVCVFWFHPSFEEIVCRQIFPVLFEFITSQRNKIWITTHSKYAEWLNKVNS